MDSATMMLFTTFYLFVLSLVSRLITKSWRSPSSIYHLVWFGLFVLGSLPVIRYNPLSGNTILAVIASHTIFCFVSIALFAFANKEHRIIPVPEPSQAFTPQTERRFRLVLQMMILIGMIGAFLALWNGISRFGGLEQFLARSQKIRVEIFTGEYGIPFYLSFLRAFNYACTPLCAYYLFKTNNWLKLWVYIPLFSVLIESISNFGRTLFIWNSLLFVTCILILFASNQSDTKRLLNSLRQHSKQILVLGLLLVLIWQGADLVRQLRGNFDNLKSTASRFAPYTDLPVGESYLLNSVVSNYVLATGGLFAFNEIVNLPAEDYYWGGATFESAIDMINKLTGLEIASRRVNRYLFVNIPFQFNVHTFLREPYEDGGIEGVVIFSFCLGFFASHFDIRWRRTASIGSYIMLAFALLLIEYSIIVNLFAASSIFWLSPILAILATRMIFLPSRRATSARLTQETIHA